MKKECIRNHPVFCMGSVFCSRLNDPHGYYWNYKSVSELLASHSRNEILTLVCKEDKNEETLTDLFEQAKKSKTDNEAFVFANKIDGRYALRVDSEKRILLYCFQDRVRIGRRKIFPWDWPHVITEIGTQGDCREEEIAKDFKRLSPFQFMAKYEFHRSPAPGSAVRREDRIYKFSDLPLAIQIDGHITLIDPRDGEGKNIWPILGGIRMKKSCIPFRKCPCGISGIGFMPIGADDVVG